MVVEAIGSSITAYGTGLYTVADLVFLWFVWITDVSIVYSLHGRKRDSFRSRLYQIVRCSIILVWDCFFAKIFLRFR